MAELRCLNEARLSRSGGDLSAIKFMAIKRRGRVIVRSRRHAGRVLYRLLSESLWSFLLKIKMLSATRGRKRQDAVESGYEVPLVGLQTSS